MKRENCVFTEGEHGVYSYVPDKDHPDYKQNPLIDEDCDNCAYFETYPINYPSGKCRVKNCFCGVYNTCNNFSPKRRRVKA